CNTGWKYDQNSYHTIASQWDLVCSDAVWTDTSQVIFKAGAATGELIGAYLMDRFGRKPMHLAGLFGIAVVGASISLAQDFIMFSVLRFILGFFISISTGAGLVLLIELFDAQRRDFAAIASECFWVMGYMLAGFAGYMCIDWRIYQAIASSIALIVIHSCRFLVESPLWISAKGKYDKAEKALKKIARWNNVRVTRIRLKRENAEAERLILMENKVMTSQEEIKHATSPEDVKIVDLFKDGVLLRHCWVFTNFLVYFFLILSSPSFAGGRFLNYYLGGLVEIPAYIFAFLVCKKLGRRLPVVVLHCIVALALVVVIVLHFVNMSVAAEVPLVLTSTLIGKMAITASFAIILPYTKELVPTNIRSV
ncbi:hypothetical protein CAPTEDRAFT_44113, partial [Capitella teleta]